MHNRVEVTSDTPSCATGKMAAFCSFPNTTRMLRDYVSVFLVILLFLLGNAQTVLSKQADKVQQGKEKQAQPEKEQTKTQDYDQSDVGSDNEVIVSDPVVEPVTDSGKQQVVKKSPPRKGLFSKSPERAKKLIEMTDSPFPEKVYGKLPLMFEENRGQFDESVKFLARGNGYTLFLTQTETVIVLGKSAGLKVGHRYDLDHSDDSKEKQSARAILRMKFVGAESNPVMSGLDMLSGKSHYFLGNDPGQWYAEIPIYEKVLAQDIYPGIDVVFRGNQRQLEYDVLVSPGADPVTVEFEFNGASRVHLDADGALHLSVKGEEVILHAPKLFQEINGETVSVAGSYTIKSAHRVGFQVAAYDLDEPLVIDPILSYSTFLGAGSGSGVEFGFGITADADGNAYVVGTTNSVNFPVLNAAQSGKGSTGSDDDAFILKLDPTGSTLVFSTYLGGSQSDAARDVSIDGQGNVYVVGTTRSADFPTVNAFQSSFGGDRDIFITKLDATGTTFVYSTFFGGAGRDEARAVAINGAGNAFVTGSTRSADFPILNAVQPVLGGSSDIFVFKLNVLATALDYSTYIGGSSSEFGLDIAVDTTDNAFVTGFTQSTDFPTVNAYQSVGGGAAGLDAFVFKLGASGSSFVYSTYLGGSGQDIGSGLAVDVDGHAYVGGQTASTDFPVVAAFQPLANGGIDAFITKFNPAGSSLVYSTYLGSAGNDVATGVDVDDALQVILVGHTNNPNFPLQDPVQATFGGLVDAFITQFDPAGSALIYSTYLGGSGNDQAQAVSLDDSGNTYLTGFTASGDFPTIHPLQGTINGPVDAFVAKITRARADLSLQKNVLDERAVSGSSLTYELVANNAGPDTARELTITDVLPEGTTFISASLPEGSCETPAVDETGTVICTMDSLILDESVTATLVVNVTAVAGSVITNTANVSSAASEAEPADNEGSVSIVVNSDPVANDDSVSIQEDSGTTTLFVLGNDTDVDGDSLSIIVVGLASHGVSGLASSSSVFYTPDDNFFGSDAFTYTISDGFGGSASATVHVTVEGVNDDPQAFDESVVILEDSGVNTIDVLSNDTSEPDIGEVLRIVSISGSNHGTVKIVDGGMSVTYMPDLNFFGSDSFDYEISDGNGGSASATVEIVILNVNDAPIAHAGADQVIVCSALSGTMVTLDGSGSFDIENDPLNYNWTGVFPEGKGTVSGIRPYVTLPIGSSVSTLVVNDGALTSLPDTVNVRVIVDVDGLDSPLGDLALLGETAPLPRKDFKQGRTLPLKIQMSCGIDDLSDSDVSAPRLASVFRDGMELDLSKLDLDSGKSNSNTLLFRYDEDKSNWIYNLNTKELQGGEYTVLIALPDGMRYTARFILNQKPSRK